MPQEPSRLERLKRAVDSIAAVKPKVEPLIPKGPTSRPHLKPKPKQPTLLQASAEVEPAPNPKVFTQPHGPASRPRLKRLEEAADSALLDSVPNMPVDPPEPFRPPRGPEGRGRLRKLAQSVGLEAAEAEELPDPAEDWKVTHMAVSPVLGRGRIRVNPAGVGIYLSPSSYPSGKKVSHRADDLARIVPPGKTIDQYEQEVLKKKFPSRPRTTSSLDVLDSGMRGRFESLLDSLRAEGIRVDVRETKRSQEVQEYYFQQGRSRRGPEITWTLTSNHADGRAADVLLNRDASGKDKAYRRMQELAPKFGLETLFDAGDPGHVELAKSIAREERRQQQ